MPCRNLSLLLLPAFFLGCALFYETETTYWEYEEPRNGGFQKLPPYVQETPPDMVLVEGGTFVEYLNGEPKTDTVARFYISKCEETNGQYLAYLDFIKQHYSKFTYRAALPDTTVWFGTEHTGGTKEFLAANYLRHPAYADYPVVGLSPAQIEKYAWWKTDRINEFIMKREGLLEWDFEIIDSTCVFVTLDYLAGKSYVNLSQQRLSDLSGSERSVRMEDGILLPMYRLAGEMEWRLAMMALPDSWGNYPDAPKPMNIKRYDKTSQFNFLYLANAKKPGKQDPQLLSLLDEDSGVHSKADKSGYYLKLLHPSPVARVYEDNVNGLGIFGMTNGLPEIAKRDSFNFVVMNPESMDPFAEVPFEKPVVAGFRLVMHCLGLPEGFGRLE
jgi:hypothetical protein